MGRVAVYNFYERDLDRERLGGGQLIGPPAYSRSVCLYTMPRLTD